MSQVYVDEITQSFVSDGNVFLKMGAVTGDVDQVGKDIKSCPVTLVIPLSKFQEFVTNMISAGEAYNMQVESEIDLAVTMSPKDTLGLSLSVIK